MIAPVRSRWRQAGGSGRPLAALSAALQLEKFRGRSASGQARWSVLDSIRLSDVSSNEVVVSETCSLGESPDKGIVAIAGQTDEPEFSSIRTAWRADEQRARWVQVDAASVHCWNEAAGAS